MSPRTKEQTEELRRQRREQILTAARHVFGRQGFHATRMSDIARETGVSQGTLYHYFSGKDELFMALFAAWTGPLEDAIEGLPDLPSSAAERLRLMTEVGLSFLRADRELLPVFVEFWAYALRNPKAARSFSGVFQTLRRSIAEIVSEGVARGEFKPCDVETLSSLPLVVLDGTLALSLIVGEDVVNPEELIRQTLEVVFEGLLAEPQGDPP